MIRTLSSVLLVCLLLALGLVAWHAEDLAAAAPGTTPTPAAPVCEPGRCVAIGIVLYDKETGSEINVYFGTYGTALPATPGTPVATATPRPTRTATPTVPPSATLTPSSTAPPTNTPRPSDEPTPTQETAELTVTPAPTSILNKTCALRAGGVNLRIRASASLGAAIRGSWGSGTVRGFTRFAPQDGYLWGQHAEGWSAVRQLDPAEWLVYGVQGEDGGTSDACVDVEGWPANLKPPAPLVLEPPDPGIGPHLLIGANSGAIYDTLSAWDTMKCINEPWICRTAKQLKPDLTIVFRLTGHDCPAGGWTQPDAFYDWHASRWADGFDFYELTNECLPDAARMDEYNAWWIRVVDLANADGLRLLLFSYSAGTPDYYEWWQSRPILDHVLAHPLRVLDGRPVYHGIALHQPGYLAGSGDPWVNAQHLADRHVRVFETLFGGAYTPAIPIYITELGYNSGRRDDPRPVSCADVAAGVHETLAHYRPEGIIAGAHVWSFGCWAGCEWIDLSAQGCEPVIAARLS